MSSTVPAYTPDELLVCTIAAQIQPGDIVVQGIATPLVLSAFMLAKVRRIPQLQFLYTSGGTISDRFGPIRLCGIEELTVRGCLRALHSPAFHAEFAASMHTKEFLRPAQVDGSGRTNNVVIGDFTEPKVRLPGCGGIADVTEFNPNLYLYVPRHDRRALVERLDFVSGTGGRIQGLFTNLCIFGFSHGRAQLRSIHPGVTLEQIREQTGFQFRVPDLISVTPEPDPEEVRVLRAEVDPLGLRRLEFATGPARLNLLKEVVAAEKQLFEAR